MLILSLHHPPHPLSTHVFFIFLPSHILTPCHTTNMPFPHLFCLSITHLTRLFIHHCMHASSSARQMYSCVDSQLGDSFLLKNHHVMVGCDDWVFDTRAQLSRSYSSDNTCSTPDWPDPTAARCSFVKRIGWPLFQTLSSPSRR